MTETLNEIEKLINDFDELKIKERNGSTFLIYPMPFFLMPVVLPILIQTLLDDL